MMLIAAIFNISLAVNEWNKRITYPVHWVVSFIAFSFAAILSLFLVAFYGLQFWIEYSAAQVLSG